MVTRPSDLVRLGLAVEFDEGEGDGPPAPSWLARAGSRYTSIELLVRMGVATEVKDGRCSGGGGCGCQAGDDRQAASRDSGEEEELPLGGSTNPAEREMFAMDQLEGWIQWWYENRDPLTGFGSDLFEPRHPDRSFGGWGMSASSDDARFEPPDAHSDCTFGEADAPLLDRRSRRCSDSSLSDSLNVRDTCGPSWKRLARAAWCMLAENADIIEWVGEIALGPGVGTQVNDLISRSWPSRVDLTCDDERHPADVADGRRDAFGGVIHLYTRHFDPHRWIRTWRCAETNADALVPVIVTAATLAHELVHLVDETDQFDDVELDTSCEPVNLFHNSIGWALATRYPTALTTECGAMALGSNAFPPTSPLVSRWMDDSLPAFPFTNCDQSC